MNSHSNTNLHRRPRPGLTAAKGWVICDPRSGCRYHRLRNCPYHRDRHSRRPPRDLMASAMERDREQRCRHRLLSCVVQGVIHCTSAKLLSAAIPRSESQREKRSEQGALWVESWGGHVGWPECYKADPITPDERGGVWDRARALDG